jgi:hypothetical protein
LQHLAPDVECLREREEIANLFRVTWKPLYELGAAKLRVVIARMIAATARTIPKTYASLAGSGFVAMCPLLAQIDVAMLYFRGAKRKDGVSYFTRFQKFIRRVEAGRLRSVGAFVPVLVID